LLSLETSVNGGAFAAWPASSPTWGRLLETAAHVPPTPVPWLRPVSRGAWPSRAGELWDLANVRHFAL